MLYGTRLAMTRATILPPERKRNGNWVRSEGRPGNVATESLAKREM
jgi:hypothetical protein